MFAPFLRRIGFVRIDDDPDGFAAVEDLSSSVELGEAGQARISVDKVMQTRGFQRDLRMLEEVAAAHRRRELGE